MGIFYRRRPFPSDICERFAAMKIAECTMIALLFAAMVVMFILLPMFLRNFGLAAQKLRQFFWYWKPKNPFLPAGALLASIFLLFQIVPQEMPTITIVPCRCHESSTATGDELSCILRPGRLSELQSLPVIRVGAPSADFLFANMWLKLTCFLAMMRVHCSVGCDYCLIDLAVKQLAQRHCA